MFVAIIFIGTLKKKLKIILSKLSGRVNHKNASLERKIETCRNTEHLAVQSKANKQKAIGAHQL